MVTDKIGDLLTRLRNAAGAGHRFVEIPGSKLKLGIVKVLYEQGYIEAYKFTQKGPKTTIKIALKYDPITKRPAITEMQRFSKPGLRKYSNADNIPFIRNGLGVLIVTTSRGIMTDKQAREQRVGGELLCYVY